MNTAVPGALKQRGRSSGAALASAPLTTPLASISGSFFGCGPPISRVLPWPCSPSTAIHGANAESPVVPNGR